MKKYKQVASLLVAIMISCSLVTHVIASDYLTDMCFKFNYLEGPMAGQSGTVQFSVFDMGAGNYILTSVVANNLIQSTAVIKGNEVFISSTDTGWFGNDGSYIVTTFSKLDAQTLNGTFRSLDIEATLGNQGGTTYNAGTIEVITCP